jgi:hypothetical protein
MEFAMQANCDVTTRNCAPMSFSVAAESGEEFPSRDTSVDRWNETRTR